MSRFLIWVACCVAWTLVLAGGDVSAQAIGQSEMLLPDTTQGFFAISNVNTLDDHWQKTQLGHLMADPVMEPFKKDIHRQFEARWLNGPRAAGADVGRYARRARRRHSDRPDPAGTGKSALAIVIDVTGKLPQAQEMLQKVTVAQAKRGARRSEVKVKGCPDPVIQFDLPELEEEKEAERSTLQGSAKSEAEKKALAAAASAGKTAQPKQAELRQAFYCLTGNLLAVTDNFEIMKGILGRATGQQNDSLASHKPFQTVMQRCKLDYSDSAPQARWFIHPVGYAEAARAATPDSQRRKGRTILEVMRHQGVNAILGVGGFVNFSSEGYELVHRTAIDAPPPYEKAMKMLVLPNQGDFAPQPWVPTDIATYTTLYFDIHNAFDHFGSIFDELFAQGAGGHVARDFAKPQGRPHRPASRSPRRPDQAPRPPREPVDRLSTADHYHQRAAAVCDRSGRSEGRGRRRRETDEE